VQLRALLDMPDLRLRLLTGNDRLDRSVRWVYTTDLRNPARYLAGGELVLTGMVWRRGPDDSAAFVGALAAAGAAALAAGYADNEAQSVPADLVAACRAHGLPLFEVPPEVSFGTITERVVGVLSAERGAAGAPAPSRDRLHALVAAGSGPAAMCALLSAETGGGCWVLSPSGRLVAGRSARLATDDRLRLAALFLRAERLPEVVRLGGRAYSLLPVATGRPPLSGWCLVLDGDHATLPSPVRALVTEVSTLLALERSRHDEALRLAARQGEQLVRLAATGGASPSEVASRLRVAGFAPDEPVAVLVMAADPRPTTPLTVITQELCAHHHARTLVTRVGDEAVALLAVELEKFAALVTTVRRAAEALRPGLGTARLSIGVSVAAASAAGLRAALEEARHVRRLGEHRPGQVRVADADELASHALLLATVPEDLRRSFRARLLGPVIAYDREHRSDLLTTLQVFLECSGSWTRCAERLHLHVNTLRYRIGRIEQLTGRNLSSFTDRVDLFLALRLG
jgi:sugar diacid utilization regulator